MSQIRIVFDWSEEDQNVDAAVIDPLSISHDFALGVTVTFNKTYGFIVGNELNEMDGLSFGPFLGQPCRITIAVLSGFEKLVLRTFTILRQRLATFCDF